jgi:hypothetical protein
MDNTLKLKIGEFARLGQVTVQTLRYYADLELLRPGEVDPFTGYATIHWTSSPRCTASWR